ncbi:unnamed protein product [Eruca vesicaria subsp. sativa]|uniref:RING-type E3 ubiquitin transferase n=1 Tax=Eruca vesicaria subsp. sativa TaxID=29727 RepID=A0ABC8J586_ERUVS|nr:unnamed protein product [Eruca vesicaria subsp. sativa]
MASTKPGPVINLEEEAEDGGAAAEGSIFTTSVFVCDSPLDERDIDCDPYFPFAGHPISDSEPDPYICPIDFFDRDTSEAEAGVYLGSEGVTGDDFNVWGFYEPKEEEEEEIVLGTRCESGSGSDQQGLRVTGLDSDSDYEDGVFDFTYEESGNLENESGRVEVVGAGLPPLWDYDLGDETEEWEEVQNAINLTVRAFSRSEEEEEELSSQSRDDHEEEEHELDWQVLITINNVVNYIEQAEGITISPGDIDPSYYMYLASLGDGENDDDAVLGHIFDNEAGIRGNPPASKSVIEDLPVVEVALEEGDMVCAVCKDEMVLEEEVKRLPCRHLYHGECITPWLGIRNTCPVCRFELPTDDLEYERHRRSQRSDTSLFLAG